jgi:hypothetical protein
MTKGKHMEFFNTLPDALQKEAIDTKMESLYDSWYDAYISEAGDEFANYVEEELLRNLHPVVQELAKLYYEKRENANA